MPANLPTFSLTLQQAGTALFNLIEGTSISEGAAGTLNISAQPIRCER